MKIIFFGTPDFVVPILETLTKHHQVVAVVTAPDQKVGRKQFITPPPVKVFAEEHHIEIIQPTNLSPLTSHLSPLNPDLYVVAAYGKIIPEEILAIPQYGAINIHPSLLPKYRGATPIQTALLNGDKTSGITFMKMDKEMDHGPILHQVPFTLEKTDTSESLMKSKFAEAAALLPHVIDEYISGKITPEPQDETQATYTKMVTKQDGFINLQNPPAPQTFDQMVRAYYPWPNVWTVVRSTKHEARIKFLPNQQIQMEGKNAVSLKDFINGYPELKEIHDTLKKFYV